MPGGHMSEDGSFRLWVNGTGFTQRYGMTFQALPWLEASFRYIGTRNFSPKYKTYYDRSFGLKIRLIEESRFWPDVSVGLLDIVGTSIESGEYLAASKHIGPLDFTLGMGWGRLAGTGMLKNPFTYISNTFAHRSGTGGLNNTGQVRFGQFFRGPDVSLFGGVIWRTPIDGLDLIGEYSSDTYKLEHQRGAFHPRTQFNVGASYHALNWLDLNVAWMYGSAVVGGIVVNLEPQIDQYPFRLGTQPMTAKIRTDAVLAKLSKPPTNVVPPAVASMGSYGNTMYVETRGDVDHAATCGAFADLAATARKNHFEELAISDADDPTGAVTFCGLKATEQSTEATLAQFVDFTPTPTDAERMALAKARLKAIEYADGQGLQIDALRFEGDTVTVAFSNTHYRTEPEADGRLARVLMSAVPDNIEQFRLISMIDGMPVRDITIPRSSLERVIAARGGGGEILPAIVNQPALINDDLLSKYAVQSYPKFDWAILPEYNQSLFDPDQPFRLQFLAGFRGGMDVTRNLRLEGEFQVNVFDTFDNLRGSNSALPHVRSDTAKYFNDGKNGISELKATYSETLGRGLYGALNAGILENMFAGVGGEILWRPEGSRWAFEASLYQVWQRGYDRLFDLIDYNVLTGHVGVYYESPYYGLNFRLYGGRYLAGDYGATLEITRRFDTGVEIGAFATFTNVPFSEFGEGSFDKGFIIRIPIDWVAPVNSQSVFTMNLRPLTRDGGQMLDGEQTLYDTTRRASYGEIVHDADQIVNP